MKAFFASTTIRPWILVAILAVFLLLMRNMSTPGNAQSPDGESNSQKNERVLENTVPAHIPIAIKMRKEKEKSFKDIENENWLREFELEVTNTGEKPIYFLYLTLIPDVKTSSGDIEMFPLTFGRVQLGDLRNRAAADDIPIKPGETYTFKIHPGQLRGWEMSQAIRPRPLPKKIQLKIELINFGDGTGFFNEIPMPNVKAPSNLRQSRSMPNKSSPLSGNDFRSLSCSPQQQSPIFQNWPAAFVPASFLFDTTGRKGSGIAPKSMIRSIHT
jgi:hypothetical protein